MATRILQSLAQEYNHNRPHWHTEVNIESANTEAFDVSGEDRFSNSTRLLGTEALSEIKQNRLIAHLLSWC